MQCDTSIDDKPIGTQTLTFEQLLEKEISKDSCPSPDLSTIQVKKKQTFKKKEIKRKNYLIVQELKKPKQDAIRH